MKIENNKNVLVIDNSSTNLVLLEAILVERGYTIQTAYSVKEAYAIMTKFRPDLILLDLLMPRINGFEFLNNIKADKNLMSIPIVVISAVTDAENIKKAIKLGADQFVTKPVDIQNICEIVDTYFE